MFIKIKVHVEEMATHSRFLGFFFTFYNYFLIYFFIEGYLFYGILLFSVKPQHESATGIHISPPF